MEETPSGGRRRRRRKVIIVGGSIAGLSCAKALLQPQCRCQVLVLERASSSLTAAGAGLGLDTDACQALQQWGLAAALASISMPLTIEESRAIDPQTKVARLLARDEEFNNRSAHWSDVHRILFEALPQGTVQFGQELVGFEEIDEGRLIVAKVRTSSGSDIEIKEFVGDLLVAADGINSTIRQRLLPSDRRRYCGYCAWRGVFDYSEPAAEEIANAVKKAYADLGKCLYFDLAPGTHAVVYELPGKRLNWLWYFCKEEPNLKGNSVTLKADESMIKRMHEEASQTFTPELTLLMQSTKLPFVNAIFDRDPLKQIVWGRVVLVGEAAHPTSPHGLRSTNMSIMDAFVLGSYLANYEDLNAALSSYQSIRLPVTAQQVLFSRHLGKVKQGLLSIAPEIFPWMQADEETCLTLLQRNIKLFKL